MCNGADDTHTLDIIKRRLQMLEIRISQDIALIRDEFYNELSVITKDDEGIHTATSLGEALETKIDAFEEDMSYKLKALAYGLSKEKRIRTDIHDVIQNITTGEIGLMKASFDTMTKHLTTYYETTVNGLKTKEELAEIIKLLKDINGKLLRAKYHENEIKCSEKVSHCADLLKQGHVTSGVYSVYPETIWRPIKVFCDMETAGGGWTVFQRRKDGSENFNRKWLDYAFGFGDLSGEFWLGNEFIHRLTDTGPHELLIEMEDFDNEHRVAEYGLFSVGSNDEGYKLSVDFFTGNISDSLIPNHDGHQFSTTDHGPSTHCSDMYKGGWWYYNCHNVNINGLYLKGKHKSYADGINWTGWHGYHYSMKSTAMKFRPK